MIFSLVSISISWRVCWGNDRIKNPIGHLEDEVIKLCGEIDSETIALCYEKSIATTSWSTIDGTVNVNTFPVRSTLGVTPATVNLTAPAVWPAGMRMVTFWGPIGISSL